MRIRPGISRVLWAVALTGRIGRAAPLAPAEIGNTSDSRQPSARTESSNSAGPNSGTSPGPNSGTSPGPNSGTSPGPNSGTSPASERRKRVKPPRLSTFVKANYPPNEHRSALVVLFLTIDRGGRVTDVSVAASDGAAFDRAAAEAARQFVFEAAEIDGRKVPVRIRYTYAFTYKQSPLPRPKGGNRLETNDLPPAPTAPIPEERTKWPPLPTEVVVRGRAARQDAVEVQFDVEGARQFAGTEGDPAKIVEDLPGTARAAFGAGQPILWGSAPDDTRVYVDGVEVPRLFHSGGLRSTIPGDLLRDITLVPGAYGARYGRGLGGVVRMETGPLPTDGLHGSVGADTLDGHLSARAPLTQAVRVGVAGRWGWVDRLLQLAGQAAVGNTVSIPRYADGQAKIEAALGPRESLELVLLGSTDWVERSTADADPAEVQSETTTDAFQRLYARYRQERPDGSRFEVVPWIGQDAYHSTARFGLRPVDVNRRALRWGLRSEDRSRLGPRTLLSVGLDVNAENADLSRTGSMSIPHREGDVGVFGQPPSEDLNSDAWHADVVGLGPYAQVDWTLGPFAFTPALRLEGFLIETSRRTPRVGQTPGIGLSHLEASLCPRLSMEWRADPRLTLFAAGGTYAQPPATTDLSAVFGTPSLGLASALHLAGGTRVRLAPSLSAETTWFFKSLQDLAVRDSASTPKLAEALQQTGEGRGYGMQLLVRRDVENGLSGMVSYTISRAERTARAGADSRLFDQDQSHVLSVAFSQKLGRLRLGARLRYARGLPRTPVIDSFYDAKNDTYQPVFGEQNSVRLPDFWQLDLRVDRDFDLGAAGTTLTVFCEVLNVTDHSNAEEYYYSKDYGRRQTITGLPIMPVLGIRVDR